MRTSLPVLVMLGAMTATSFVSAQSTPSVRVILVGDSTMAPRSGYGEALCARFTPTVACLNRARGGRSTKSFRVEGLWDGIVQLMGDKQFQQTYVLIQFGHNDQPGKPERSTTLPEFTTNLRRYVEETRANGATPVLVTPLTRRQFKDGKVVRSLDDWASATRSVAKDTDTALLDLHADSVAAVEAVGPTVANTYAPSPPPAAVAAAALTGTTIEAPKPEQPDPANPAFDYTHLGADGAARFASIVASEIRIAVPDLCKLLQDL